jgi:hypothetical protein
MEDLIGKVCEWLFIIVISHVLSFHVLGW